MTDFTYTDEQLRIIRSELLPPETTDGEFDLFIQQCYRTRLDPFARQIQGTPGRGKNKKTGNYEFKLTIVVTIDGFRAIAERRGEYDGQTEQEWCGKDGVWTSVWLDDDNPPFAARCGVYKKNTAHPSYAVMKWAESPGGGNKPSPIWRSMRSHMLSKCAEALALRKAFPNDLAGLYTDDEMSRSSGSAPSEVAASDSAPVPVVRVEEYEMDDDDGRAVKYGWDCLEAFEERREAIKARIGEAREALPDKEYSTLRGKLIDKGILGKNGHLANWFTPEKAGEADAFLAGISEFVGEPVSA